jgi:hypothetical protein
MTVSILFSSVNYLNKTANLMFYPLTGGVFNLGVITIPYTYNTNQYIYGQYHLYFPALDKTCVVNIPLPPTPTPTPTPSITPTTGATPTPTPTNTVTPTVTPTPTLRGFNTNFDIDATSAPTILGDPIFPGLQNGTLGIGAYTDLPAPFTLRIEVQDQGVGSSTRIYPWDVYIDVPGAGIINVYVDFSDRFDGSPLQIEVWNGPTKYVYGAISLLDTSNPVYVLDSVNPFFGTPSSPWTQRGAG